MHFYEIRRPTARLAMIGVAQATAAWCAFSTVGFAESTVAVPKATRMIVIDPGHGGSEDVGSDSSKNKSTNNNATSPKQRIKEKDLALELSKLIADSINSNATARQRHLKAVLTRQTDTNLDFTKRVDVAAKANAACYVAIHFNGSASHRVSGPRAVVQQQSKNPNFAADKKFGIALATAVENVSHRFRPGTPAATWQDDRELHGGWGSYLFYQLNQNPKTRLIPSCHLEVEFLDNYDLEVLFFVQRKDAIFNAWASAIAEELIREALNLQQ